MGPRCTEVVVWPERFIECRDEVEESLPTTLVTQRVLPVLAALPQPRRHREKKQLHIIPSKYGQDALTELLTVILQIRSHPGLHYSL